DRTWEALQQSEHESGQPHYTLLHFRADHPHLPAAEAADRLAVRLGKSLTAAWVHKHLHLARHKFTDLLVEEVARSLERPTAAELEEELLELGLLDRCRAALERWRGCHDHPPQ